MCWVRIPSSFRTLELEFFQLDVSNIKFKPKQSCLYVQIHDPPEKDGDWLTIHPNPTQEDKYYGTDLHDKHAPPHYIGFKTDEIVTICFKTRKSVDSHDGFVAEVRQMTLPSTVGETDVWGTGYSIGSTWQWFR